MPRRISTGVTGRSILGNYFSSGNIFGTLPADENIEFAPNGTGETVVNSNLRIQGASSLVFNDNSEDNSVSIQSPELSSDYTLTLPTDIGTAGDVLTVDGSGNLSFTDLTIEVSNQSADTATYYPLISTSASGSISSVETASSKLSFVPNSGTLSADVFSDGSLSISSGSISSATNGTFSGTVQAGSITETSSLLLKTDIDPLTDSIDKISRLNPVEFTRKSNGKREVGLIAEEVEQVIPELVDSHGDYKTVSYSRLTAYLIDAIKNLSQVKNG